MHARDLQPRPEWRPRGGGRRARAAGRAPRAARPRQRAQRHGRHGAVPVSATAREPAAALARERPAPARRPTPTLAAVRALLRKELLVELRTLESVPGMSLFAVTTFVVFHFALNRNSIDGDLAAGIL